MYKKSSYTDLKHDSQHHLISGSESFFRNRFIFFIKPYHISYTIYHILPYCEKDSLKKEKEKRNEAREET